MVSVCTNLVSIHLGRLHRITDVSVHSLAISCPRLGHLNISKCSGITDNGVRALVDSGSPVLQRLVLSGCNVTDDSFCDFDVNRLHSLREISLDGCCHCGNATLSWLSRACPQLLCLKVGGCTRVTDVGVGEAVTRMSNLSTLSLRGCKLVTSQGIMTLSERAVRLHTLDVRGCVLISSTTLFHLNRVLPRLRLFRDA